MKYARLCPRRPKYGHNDLIGILVTPVLQPDGMSIHKQVEYFTREGCYPIFGTMKASAFSRNTIKVCVSYVLDAVLRCGTPDGVLDSL